MVYTVIANKLETLKNIRTSERKKGHPEINELRNKVKAIELSKKWKSASFEEKRGECGIISHHYKRGRKYRNRLECLKGE